MTVLITGGAGYIGSHMVLEFVDAGERLVVLDNLSTGHDWAVAAGVPLVVGDSGDQELVGRLLRDVLSSPLMINNERILSNIATSSLMSGVPTSLRD